MNKKIKKLINELTGEINKEIVLKDNKIKKLTIEVEAVTSCSIEDFRNYLDIRRENNNLLKKIEEITKLINEFIDIIEDLKKEIVLKDNKIKELTNKEIKNKER
jgi:hypothetical protein